MNKEEFVEKIKLYVRDSGIETTIRLITHPPGRQPPENLVEIGDWYKLLNDDAKARIHQIVKLSIDTGLFGLFCVLDGARVIEEATERGELKLFYEKNGEQILLNEDKGEYLHDIFNDVTS